MHFSILTLFPEMFYGTFDTSIVKRACDEGIASIEYTNIRNFATDRYKSVDDHPYGGGHGMILKVDIMDKALSNVKCQMSPPKADQPLAGNVKCKERAILLDPTGKVYTQAKAREYTKLDHLILICGHYEGVDERVASLVDEQISIGDYVLTGGELAAMVVIDSVVRLLPGVLSKKIATEEESFRTDGGRTLLEYPQYTRPLIYKNKTVPKILLSGNHKAILAWRLHQAGQRTKKLRPDLLHQKN